MKKLLSTLLLISSFTYGQTLLKLKAIETATAGAGQTVITNTLGQLTYTPCNSVPGLLPSTTSLTINGTTKTFTSTPSYTVNLQDAINQSNVVDGDVMKSLDGLSAVNFTNGNYIVGVSNGVSTSQLDISPTSVSMSGNIIQANGHDIATTTGTETLTNKTITSPTFSTSTTYSYATVLRVPIFDASKKLVSSSTTNTQLSYLDATSSIQTQLNSKDVTSTSTNTLTNKTVSSGTLTGVTTQSTTNFNGAFNATYTTAASSSTVDLSTINANYVSVTGTTTINSFGTVQAGAQRTILFNGVLTVTSSTNIVLPGSTSIKTAANDIMVIVSDGSGVWRCVSYAKADESFISFPSSVTGFTTGLTVSSSYKMLTRNTYLFNLFTSLTTSTATTLTFTTPFNYPSGTNSMPIPVWVYDNSVQSIGFILLTPGSNVVSVFKGNGGAFTASGLKSVRLSVVLISDIQ